MKTHFIYLAVVAALIIFIGFNRESPEPIIVTETITRIDSTVVDSLTREIEVLKAQPAETVRVEIPVPIPTETGNTTEDGTPIREYYSAFRDSNIVANWKLTIAGELLDQDFEYIPRPATIIRETTTKYLTQYRTTETTTTITQREGGFLSIGGDIGFSPLSKSIGSIQLRYQSKEGYSYHFRYDPILEGYYGGITVPIRLKQIFKL